MLMLMASKPEQNHFEVCWERYTTTVPMPSESTVTGVEEHVSQQAARHLEMRKSRGAKRQRGFGRKLLGIGYTASALLAEDTGCTLEEQ